MASPRPLLQRLFDRVVKVLHSKCNGKFSRRFESCSSRSSYFFFFFHFHRIFWFPDYGGIDTKAGQWWLKCRMQMQNAGVFRTKNASTIDIWVVDQPAAFAFDIWDLGFCPAGRICIRHLGSRRNS